MDNLQLNHKKQGRTLLERIQDLSVPDPNSGCWLWVGNVWPDGYPQIQVDGKPMRGNRAALIAIGVDLSGKQANHKCDTPLCVNPDHLYAGTQSENIKDSWARGNQKGRWK